MKIPRMEKEDLVLLFDIGSSSVGGSFLKIQKSGAPKIVFSVREQIPFKDEINVDQFLALTLGVLEVVAEKAYMAGFGAPTKIFCTLASPWYVSQTRIINYAKNTPFIFTTKLADSLIQNEVNLFETEHLAQYAHTEHSARIIELKNIKIMINGYETINPVNQKGKELEMTVFVSMSPEKILKKIEDTIAQHFHFKEIIFSSFVMAFFTVIRDLYSHQDDFLLVDIGGEVTDISMVKRNILRESFSFPLGRNSIVRGVASTLNYSIDEAKSSISLFKDDHAEVSVVKKLEPIISKLKTDWLQKFQESLASLSHDISIPPIIYMAIDKDFVGFFSEIIKTEQFNQYTLTDSKFEVIVLSSQMFQGMAVFEGEVPRDPFLTIDSIYINRFLHKI
ncbi:MAG: hypothetical protein Q7K54_03150 [Candidatus Parcubacteria bacterium]|nr:hypothetical protein [Candidatus Parcubacteria bacterium]